MADIFLNIIGVADKHTEAWKKVRSQQENLEKESKKVNQQMQNHFNGTGQVLQKITGYLGAMFTIGAAVTFIKKMIEVRVEWEKQVAILKTLTGSQKEAERTMRMIRDISEASLSPISEISDAYIRLVNQGIKPSKDEMKKMLDVAMSSGKSFGQLAEAIFDASNQQTRGLKDFGITSKIEGNKIQLSFKGMTKEVDNTAKSIADFVIQAGEMEGVAGASEEVAKTLPGAIDDIGDAWERLLNTIGQKGTGPFVAASRFLKDLLNSIDALYENDPSLIAQRRFDVLAEDLKGITDKTGKLEYLDRILNELNRDLDEYNQEGAIQHFRDKKNIEATELLIEDIKDYYKQIQAGTDAETKRAKEIEETTKAIEEQIKIIPTLSEKELPAAGKELERLKNKYKELTSKEYESAGAMEVLVKAINVLKKISSDLSDDDLVKLNRRLEEMETRLKVLGGIPKLKKISDIVKDVKIIEGDLAKETVQVTSKIYDEQKKITDERVYHFRKTNDKILEIFKINAKTYEEIDQNALEEEKKKSEAREAIYQSLAEVAMSYTDLISAKNRSAMDKELAEAEGNEKAQEEIKKKYARKEQSVAVGKAVISGALAVMRIAESWSWNPPVEAALIALQAIATALQIATIKAQKFSTGVLSLKGAGSETSDSIPSMLSRGESVMTAKETREYFPYLKAMKEGRFPHLDIDLMREFGKMEKVTNNNLNYDNSREIKELRQIQELLKKHGETQYQEGSQRVIRKGNVTTRININ